MKINELTIFNKESLADELLSKDMSKEGLRQYFEESKIIVQVILQDKYGTVHVYEKDGTYPFDYKNGEKYCNPSGYFRDKPEGRKRGTLLKIFGTCNNNFDCINFFENKLEFIK